MKAVEASPEVFERIKECEKFITEHPEFKDSWHNCWSILDKIRISVPVKVYLDFAPMSFTWEAGNLTGGLIFHGQYDRGGDGGAPTFSINIEKSYGWSLHT